MERHYPYSRTDAGRKDQRQDHCQSLIYSCQAFSHRLLSELRRINPAVFIGWDISGIVTASRFNLFKAGDEVFGMVNFPGHGKAYAEYVAVPADQLALKPANITHEDAAAATLAALTAFQAFHHHSQLEAGQKVLIHAAAGGVGHYAVQLGISPDGYLYISCSQIQLSPWFNQGQNLTQLPYKIFRLKIN